MTREPSLWDLQRAENPGHSKWYIERFRALEEAGQDLVGEARLIDAMAPRRGQSFDSGVTDRVVDLFAEAVDLAIHITDTPPPGLAGRPLEAVEHIVCASPAYLARHGEPRTLADLAQHFALAVAFGQALDVQAHATASNRWMILSQNGLPSACSKRKQLSKKE